MSSTPTADDVIIKGQGLSRRFESGGLFKSASEKRTVKAVDGVDLSIRRGEVFAIVGESGSGKSTLGRLLLGLLEPSDGRITFAGEDLATMDRAARMRFRRKVQVVFQDPYSSLDPRMRIGAQIREPLDIHNIGQRAGRDQRVTELLERVGLSPDHARAFPSELSGGQRQRVGIAIALASSPEVIIADEPTSALDVSVQAQVLNLLADLQRDSGLTIVFITHDLGVVRHFCDRVAVMYLGKIVEQAETAALFANPRHPYTRMLFSAIPDHDPSHRDDWEIPKGDPPSPLSPPSGCAFHPRCPSAMPKCSEQAPELVSIGDSRQAACFLSGELSPSAAPIPPARTETAAPSAPTIFESRIATVQK